MIGFANLRERRRIRAQAEKSQPRTGFRLFLHNFFTILFISGVVVSTLLLVFLIALWFFLRRDLPLSRSLNIVFTTNNLNQEKGEILFASFSNNSENKIAVARINGELSTTVIGGYGDYKLVSLMPLLQLEKKELPVISSAYSFTLGTVIDGVYTLQETSPEIETKIKWLRFLAQHTSVYQPSQLSLIDFATLANATWATENHNYHVEQVQTWEDWEKFKKGYLVTNITPGCSVTLVNTTTVDGLATQVTSLLDTSGVEIVRLLSTQEKRAQSRVSYATKECEQIVSTIENILPTTVELVQDENIVPEYRSQVVVELGEDVAEVLKNILK